MKALRGGCGREGAAGERLEAQRRIPVQDHRLLSFLAVEGVPFSSKPRSRSPPSPPGAAGGLGRTGTGRSLRGLGLCWRFQPAPPLFMARGWGLVAGRQPALTGRMLLPPLAPSPSPLRSGNRRYFWWSILIRGVRGAWGVPAPPAVEADEAPAFPAVTRSHLRSHLRIWGLAGARLPLPPRVRVCPWRGGDRRTGTGCRSPLPPRQPSPLRLAAGRASWHGAPSPTRGTLGCCGWLPARRDRAIDLACCCFPWGVGAAN